MERTLDQFNFGRIVRWALPGWVMILAFVVFVSLDIFGAGSKAPKLSCLTPPEPPGSLNCSVERFLKTLETEKAVTPTVVALLTVAAAGVPLGFLIYQVYFFLKWNSPFSRLGLWPPFITGGINEVKQIQRDIQDEELKLKDRQNSGWREAWVSHPMFEADHGFRWRYIEYLFIEAAKKIDQVTPDASLYSRCRYLYELMHLLGVGFIGVYVGFLTYFAYKTSVEERWHLLHVILVIVILIPLFFLMHFEETKKQDYQNSRNITGTYYSVMIPRTTFAVKYPASLWIMSLGVILVMAHPILAPQHGTGLAPWDWFFRIILVSGFAFAWRKNIDQKDKTDQRDTDTTDAKDNTNQKGSIRYVGVIGIIISLFLGITLFFIRDDLLSWLDWPFLFPAYVFAVINLIFVKNRQNIRDDWHALQYYALRQFLFDPKEGGQHDTSEKEDA